MNKKWKMMMMAAVFCVGTCAFANPHHKHNRNRYYDNDGLNLAAGIVDLVCRVIAPQPVIVTPVEHTIIQHEEIITPPPPVIIETHRPIIHTQRHHKIAPPPKKPVPHRGHRR